MDTAGVRSLAGQSKKNMRRTTINIVSIVTLLIAACTLIRPQTVNHDYVDDCPVAGPVTTVPVLVKATLEKNSWESEYTHCTVCSQGAILPGKDGMLRCTYCGKPQKKDTAAN